MRRRPLHPHRSTLDDPDSCSIAGRRASGFLQVSLSKVSRHEHRGARPASNAETPPMNANDFTGVIDIRCVAVSFWVLALRNGRSCRCSRRQAGATRRSPWRCSPSPRTVRARPRQSAAGVSPVKSRPGRPCQRAGLQAGAPAHVRQQRVFAWCGADLEVSPVRFGEPDGLQPFAGAPLVVVDVRKVAERQAGRRQTGSVPRRGA